MSISPIVPSFREEPVLKQSGQMNQDSFIKLLVTQLKAQNPNSPFDSNTMMQQMAQLTNLSASSGLEKTVEKLGESLNSNQVLSASQLIGKEVQVPADLSVLTADKGLRGMVIAPVDVDTARITIKDADDRLVKSFEVGPSVGGKIHFKWDGLDDNAKVSSPGLYKISATSQLAGEEQAMKTEGVFQVSSVAFNAKENQVLIHLDGAGTTKLSDIAEIL